MNKSNNISYFTVYNFMVDELKLSSNELNIYAVIHGYTVKSKSKCFFGSQEYLARSIGASRRTVNKCIRSLKEKGFIDTISTTVGDKPLEGYVCKFFSGVGENFSGMSESFSGGEKNLPTEVSNSFSGGCEKTSHNNNIYNNNDNHLYNRLYNRKKEEEEYIIVENNIPEDFYV